MNGQPPLEPQADPPVPENADAPAPEAEVAPEVEAAQEEKAASEANGPVAAGEHELAVTRTARYYTLGAVADVREVWYVLHGYGQRAATFIRPFGALDNTHRRIVAPEALSRFYLDDAHQRVGASWMTREDRLHEIADYVAYLDALHAGVVAGIRAEAEGAAVRVHVLGFSQGSETAARWAVFGEVAPYRLILWGGRLPADLDLAVHREVLRRMRLTLVHGDADEYATPERIVEAEAALNRHTIPYQVVTFEGGHRLSTDVLHELAAG